MCRNVSKRQVNKYFRFVCVDRYRDSIADFELLICWFEVPKNELYTDSKTIILIVIPKSPLETQLPLHYPLAFPFDSPLF